MDKVLIACKGKLNVMMASPDDIRARYKAIPDAVLDKILVGAVLLDWPFSAFEKFINLRSRTAASEF